ncbi:MAG: glycine/betaine ABC transporter substrate-binding protein [Gammaproteobacteria bacterium]|jgi:glycine betaine/proline transport system substrate-binding protein|nr:glycine/betaine ABC transporter substrate-binding protein [Gammaproteobacteria bacterium]
MHPALPLLTAAIAFFFTAVGNAAPPIRIAYVDWSSSVASANVVCVVLEERLDLGCELIETSADEMWRMVAEGEADAMLSAWLPDTHADYFATFGDQLDDLGPNLVGTRTGLVVPATGVGRQTGAQGERTRPSLNIHRIPELAEHRRMLGGRIQGIDPEAGIMTATERAIDVYGLAGFRLISGNEATMTEALANAVARNRPIVVTGWVPHWMFGRWSLRFLDDPEDVYGGSGRIHTMARLGLADERPRAAALLDRFEWDPQAMERLLVWVHQDQGRDPYAQALRWTRAYPDRVDAWLEAGAQ